MPPAALFFKNLFESLDSRDVERVFQPKVPRCVSGDDLFGLVQVSRCDGSYKRSTATRAVLRKHQVELDVIVNELTDFAVHQIMEFGMEAVYGTIHTNLNIERL